jgi:integrase
VPPSDDAPTLERLADGSGFRVRVRCGKARNRYRIPSTDEVFVAKRAAVLVELGAALASAPPDLAHDLLERAGEADSVGLAKIQAAARALSGSSIKVSRKAESPRAAWTVREIGEAWTGGTLAADYPDQVKVRASANDDVSRLEAHVYPVIGSLLVRAVTLEDCERVMRSIKGERRAKLSPGTRRHVALALNRLLNVAVYPLKIRAANPIPRQGFLPRKPDRGALALAHLYPSEEAALMACAEIPIERRVFWGFLAREGMRVSEALSLRWTDLDLARGAVALDENKTDDPRAWALAPGVAGALAHFHEKRDPDRVLVFEQPPEPERLATRLRADLELAGVTRAALFTRSKSRLALRAHDLRASFVTVALAHGRSEAWVTDRTGHRSHEMVERYRRAARQATELGALVG